MEKQNQWKQFNKFDEAAGLFWGASLFIGGLTAVILGFRGNGHSDWLFSALVGFFTFLICGLVSQGILTLVKKDRQES